MAEALGMIRWLISEKKLRLLAAWPALNLGALRADKAARCVAWTAEGTAAAEQDAPCSGFSKQKIGAKKVPHQMASTEQIFNYTVLF